MNEVVTTRVDAYLIYIWCACIMTGTTVFTLLIAWSRDRAKKEAEFRTPILLYSIANLAQSVPVIWDELVDENYIFNDPKFHFATSNLFMITEFLIFSILLRSIIRNAKMKRLIITMMFVFPSYSVIHWLFIHNISYNPFELSLVEISILLPITLFFFWEIFYSAPSKDIFVKSHFWIATGLLIYLLSLVPNFVVLNIVLSTDAYEFQALLYFTLFFSVVLNAFLIKAMLCKVTQ